MQQREMGQRRKSTPVMVCFGDSNTYGYDPRGFWGDRYPEESRWIDILSEKTDWMIKNAGQNGREIPRNSLQYQQAELLIAQTFPNFFAVMLGTNDLLQGATAQEAASRMERFLRHVQSGCSSILLIAPPPMQPGSWQRRIKVWPVSCTFSLWTQDSGTYPWHLTGSTSQYPDTTLLPRDYGNI